MATINRVLVANRGEIARRVFATCRRLGIQTVAVHSDADAGLPFVGEADVAVRLPGDAPADTYLRADLVLEAARRTGADAVHPGYGFLSENADFARAVLEAGLTWIGPAPESIEAMGSKVAAKELMEKAGVPVLRNLDPAEVTGADLPVLVKASAGGGGRGMRVVRRLEHLTDAVSGAETEAASAFGDGTVFVETYVEKGRHVEVQVLGDAAGTVHVLGDRDCSVQRRHQKVVEEAPAPGLPDAVRTAMHDAARAAAEAISYRGAGTVEFLYDPVREGFFFLEMNTRLQVEHPVTECVTGLDLVELQIQAAEGAGSGLAGRSPGLDTLAALAARPTGGDAARPTGGDAARPTGGDAARPTGGDAARPPGGVSTGSTAVTPQGHAVEVRLYAEDPAADYQPQSGRLTRFEVPDVDVELQPLTSYGVRLDSGFRAGDEVGTHYDAMLAKVIVWAPDRPTALRQLAGVLRRARLHGLVTNRDLLVEILSERSFVDEQLSTDFLAGAALTALEPTHGPVGSASEQALALFAAAVACTERAVAGRRVQAGVPTGWRNVTSAPQITRFDHRGTEVEVGWHGDRDGYRFADVHGEVGEARATSVEHTVTGWRVIVDQDGLTRTYDVALSDHGATTRVDVDHAAGHVALTRLPRFVDPADQVAEGSLLAPMPGTVIAVRVEAGATVTAGQPVLVMEAMKMQHTINAPTDGVVSELAVAVGEQVTAGAVLAVVSTPYTDHETENPEETA
ncbi:ATP-grasp domain-containing protein [Nocardioides sp. HDW12B]|uniref:acetyl/propionyl/methylcrotonyl-CoA carboxylase subunit alpha n=1 Tax=Nocardioides sp. HDW12B TaxID=2714939 RepID=UPI001407C7B0|nr:biotin carboxylase N-terminal domain-containing protein [Nocardioides sp. HDW12B]QIK67788.1 ATP-grasp domain-containing protein [Nocardioides sp. HDW12B]